MPRGEGRSKGSITCKYLAYRFREPDSKDFTYIRLPMVHVYLKSGDREFTTNALVDSRSTATFLPDDYLAILDLKDLHESSAEGAGGTFKTQVGRVDLVKVMKKAWTFDTFRDLTVHIPTSSEAIPYMILGRDSIFKRFDVTFHERRKRLTFTRI